MSLPARAVTTRTGHPVLKLVLLTVAVLPGYPTVRDVAAATELTESMTEDALSDLVRLRHLACLRVPGGRPQYALPGDGWTYTRADSEEDTPAVVPAPQFDGLGVALGSRAGA